MSRIPAEFKPASLEDWAKAATRSAPGGDVSALDWHTPDGIKAIACAMPFLSIQFNSDASHARSERIASRVGLVAPLLIGLVRMADPVATGTATIAFTVDAIASNTDAIAATCSSFASTRLIRFVRDIFSGSFGFISVLDRDKGKQMDPREKGQLKRSIR